MSEEDCIVCGIASEFEKGKQTLRDLLAIVFATGFTAARAAPTEPASSGFCDTHGMLVTMAVGAYGAVLQAKRPSLPNGPAHEAPK